MSNSEEVIINNPDLDTTSEFTSISHPNSENRWEEIEQTVSINSMENINKSNNDNNLIKDDGDYNGDDDDDDDDDDYDETNSALNSSVQITLKDNSSITGSVQSRNAIAINSKNHGSGINLSNNSANNISGNDSFMGRIRNIFHKKNS